MSTRRTTILPLVAAGILGAAMVLVLVVLGTFARTAGTEAASSNSGVQSAASENSTLQQAKVPTAIASSQEQSTSRRKILAGASTDQIAEYAMQNLVPEYLTPKGGVQLLTVRPVSREQVPQLGLGCLPENVSSEEPPFVLIIVKGDFTMQGVPGGRGRTQPLASSVAYQYVAMIVDVWAASPTRIIASETGGEFRQILNDLSLPVVDAHMPTNCKGWTPGTVPHGSDLPGESLPTTPIDQVVESTPAMPAIPEPISTGVVTP